MADLLQTGVEYLLGALSAHVSRTVTYKRGNTQVSLSATLGTSQWDQTNDDGGVYRVESRDYIISAATISGGIGLPRSGDLIVDEGITYEVLSPGGSQPYKNLDPFRKGLRIHTKKIKLT
jgi:hypothetical protein